MRIRPLVMEIGVATVLVLVRALQACSRKQETPALSDASPQPFPPVSWTEVHVLPLTTADYVATRNCARAVDLPGDSGGATGLWIRWRARFRASNGSRCGSGGSPRWSRTPCGTTNQLTSGTRPEGATRALALGARPGAGPLHDYAGERPRVERRGEPRGGVATFRRTGQPVPWFGEATASWRAEGSA